MLIVDVPTSLLIENTLLYLKIICAEKVSKLSHFYLRYKRYYKHSKYINGMLGLKSEKTVRNHKGKDTWAYMRR